MNKENVNSLIAFGLLVVWVMLLGLVLALNQPEHCTFQPFGEKYIKTCV